MTVLTLVRCLPAKGDVAKHVELAAAASLDWPAVQTSDDKNLERQLLPATISSPIPAECIKICLKRA